MSHQQRIGVQSLRAKLPVFRAGELHEGGNCQPANDLKIHGHSIALFEVYTTRIGRCVWTNLTKPLRLVQPSNRVMHPAGGQAPCCFASWQKSVEQCCKACRWPQLLQLLWLVAVFRAHWLIRCFLLGIRIMDPCFASVSRSFGQAPRFAAMYLKPVMYVLSSKFINQGFTSRVRFLECCFTFPRCTLNQDWIRVSFH